MPLTAEDFDGFDLEGARQFLRGFDSGTRRKGEGYFHAGAVKSVKCVEPGVSYSFAVKGSYKYDVNIYHDGDGWDASCSCPIGVDCKHVYAALKKLLLEQSRYVMPAGGPANGVGKKNSAFTAPLSELARAVEQKLDRSLEPNEAAYVKNINALFRRARGGGLYYRNELTGLGLRPDVGHWDALTLYPGPPQSEVKFWNFLALYLTEKARASIPEFMQPVTDLAAARAIMRKHFRARDIEHWKQTLSYSTGPVIDPAMEQPAAPELRARLTRKGVLFDWRPTGGNQWIEMKPRKVSDFDAKYGALLSAEAAMLWLPYFQRAKFHYTTGFDYHDAWAAEQVGRWLRQPLLRPFLVNEEGHPLVFHDGPLRWQIVQPEDDDGDYSFSLVQADGKPVPEILLASNGNPNSVYLTTEGVFSGPPFENYIKPADSATVIPAAALETSDGLRLLNRLQINLPERISSKVSTIKLSLRVRAEVKSTWSSFMEYCFVDIHGVSRDGNYVEYWSQNGWLHESSLSKGATIELVNIDRGALVHFTPLLDQAGFKWEYQQSRWQLRVTKKFAEPFVAFLKALPAGTRIELAGDLASFQNAEVAGKIRLEAAEAGMDWFDLRVIVDVGDTTLSQEEIKLLLDAKGGWVRLDKKGWRKLQFALTEEEDRELARLGLTPHELTSQPQRLHAFQLADKAARKFLPEETCERIERRAAELQARVTPDVPAAIQAEMRPYQRDGFHFLAYLSTNRFGGILADDMGLGKTLQTLAWLAWLRESVDAQSGVAERLPSLVVCPKSVADNWHAEAAKFFPALKVKAWPAAELKAFDSSLPSADLHVLNYSQLRLVGEDLARARFHAVILDEGQYIKNPSSQTAQIARQLKAEHRLILSGTPIENRLLDLWSLMSFAMPGALGSRAEFGRLYDAKNDPYARQRLSARVRPFLIRRTKAQVARDLPDRIEEDLFCELEGEQKTLYRAELKRAQAMLLRVKSVAALNKQRFNFLTSLLRLRQICCHPRLVKPDSKAVSAKVEALMETLEPLLEEGQKVLVFSQFVEMLDILRTESKGRNWPHWYLAGDTENRGALVNEFQSAKGAGVFLISLKAGGFGLNLTAASYVVLFDPWWNPAVENQAIDRTHRIGQDRKVIAYRILIKDSIEEKIRALQKQKKSLAEDVLGEEKFAQSLSLDELRYLLQD